MEAELEWESKRPEDVAQSFAHLESALSDQLADAGQDIGTRIRRDAQDNAPVDETRLRDDINEVVEATGTVLSIIVGANVDYAEPVHEGTSPGHFPPPSELRGWAARQLGDPDAAYPVARAISETGLEERPFLRTAFEENIEYAMDRILRAVRDAFAEVGLT